MGINPFRCFNNAHTPKYFLRSVLVFSFLMLADAAQAQVVAGSFSGTIQGQYTVDTYGYFGPAGQSLSGLPFTVIFSYLPSDFAPLQGDLGEYLSNDYGALTTSLTINGVTQSLVSGRITFLPDLYGAGIGLGAGSFRAGVSASNVVNGTPEQLIIEYNTLGTPTLTNPIAQGITSQSITLNIASAFNYSVINSENLTASPQQLTLVSPFLVGSRNLGNLDLKTLLPNLQTADSATALVADGTSAVIVLFQVSTSADVTFTTSNGTNLVLYDPHFLKQAPQQGSSTLIIPAKKLMTIGSALYAVALLQAPLAGVTPAYSTPITITAQQEGGQVQQAYLPLVPPPVLLVHGLWGDNKSLSHVQDYLTSEAPWNAQPSLVMPVGYNGSLAFDTTPVERSLGRSIQDAFTNLDPQGIVASRVDVVAHSMGGLVVRHYSSLSDYRSLRNRDQGAFHQIVTLNTPEQGSALASFLVAYNQNQINPSGVVASTVISDLCPDLQTSTVSACLAKAGEPLGPLDNTGAVFSLQPGSSNISLLPPAAIPGATWNAISSTLSQTYDPRASPDYSSWLTGLVQESDFI